MKKVSFDFDGTLSKPKVQEYAALLMKKGYDVWVTTARWDDDNADKYIYGSTNNDLYEITDNLGIPRENITFCNMVPKAEVMATDFILHLDDDWLELYEIRQLGKVPAINAFGNGKGWRNECNKLLGI